MGKNSVIILPSMLGILAIIIVFTAFNGKEIALISRYRSAFLLLAIINFAMCIAGPLRTAKQGEWLKIFNVTLYFLAILAIPLIIIVLTSKTPPLPIVSTYRSAIALISLIIFSKWILFFMHWLVWANEIKSS